MITLALLVASTHVFLTAWWCSTVITAPGMVPFLFTFVGDNWVVSALLILGLAGKSFFAPEDRGSSLIETLRHCIYWVIPLSACSIAPCRLCTASSNEYSSIITRANFSKYDSISILKLTAFLALLLLLTADYVSATRAGISFTSTWRVGKVRSTKAFNASAKSCQVSEDPSFLLWNSGV